MSITIPKPTRSLHRIFTVMIAFGLLFILYGFFFGPIICPKTASIFNGASLSGLKTFDKTPETGGGFPVRFLGPVSFFVTAIFVLAIVWVVWCVILSVLYIDNPELVFFVIGGLMILFGILACIFSAVLTKSFEAAYASAHPYDRMQLKLGMGPIALLIGGLLFGVGAAGAGLPTRE